MNKKSVFLPLLMAPQVNWGDSDSLLMLIKEIGLDFGNFRLACGVHLRTTPYPRMVHRRLSLKPKDMLCNSRLFEFLRVVEKEQATCSTAKIYRCVKA